MESAQNRGYFAPQGWLPTPELRVASDRPTGGAHGWLKSAAGRATGSELRTRKSLIRLDFIEQKSERSVMPQDTGVGRNVVLGGLDFASLRRVWKQTFGAAPPSSLSRVFLRRVLLHERQCRTHGGLSAATRRALAAMANETPSSAALAGSVSAGTHLVDRSGTHLVREWNGRTYQVEVIDNGYRFDGKTYPSLTTIAKRITGTHWSGPRFFGLTPKRKA